MPSRNKKVPTSCAVQNARRVNSDGGIMTTASWSTVWWYSKRYVVRTTGVFLYRSYSHRRTPFATCPRSGDSRCGERESREAMRYFASSCNPRPWVTLTAKNKKAEGPQTASIKISPSLPHNRPRHFRPVVFRNLRSYMRRTKANISTAPVVSASRVSH